MLIIFCYLLPLLVIGYCLFLVAAIYYLTKIVDFIYIRLDINMYLQGKANINLIIIVFGYPNKIREQIRTSYQILPSS